MTPKDKNLQAITENAEQLARELEAARKERDAAEKELAEALNRAQAHFDERRKLAQTYDKLLSELHNILEPRRAVAGAGVSETLVDAAKRVINKRDDALGERDVYKAQLETVRSDRNKLIAEKRAGVRTSLAAVGKRAHENCFKRGFHKPGAMRSYLKRTTHAIEELNEALLAIEREKSSYFEVGGKPEGVLAEFADAIIIISEMAHHYLASCDPGLKMQGVSLDSAVAAKLEYNDRREDGVNGNSV